MGDLNYRIDLNDEEVRRYTEWRPNFEVLLANDQLNKQKKAKKAFSDYKERFLSWSSLFSMFKIDKLSMNFILFPIFLRKALLTFFQLTNIREVGPSLTLKEFLLILTEFYGNLMMSMLSDPPSTAHIPKSRALITSLYQLFLKLTLKKIKS